MQLKLHASMGVQCLHCGVYVMKATQALEAIADYKVYEKGSKKPSKKMNTMQMSNTVARVHLLPRSCCLRSQLLSQVR